MKRAPVLLISCYEMGHPPFAIHSAAAILEARGLAVATLDLAVEPFDENGIRAARLVGISVPMHTAMRLGVEAGRRVRALNPSTCIVFFGLYASLNARRLLSADADAVIGGEFEEPLARFAQVLFAEAPMTNIPGVTQRPDLTRMSGDSSRPHLERLSFQIPTRSTQPPLGRYSHLDRDGELLLAGYTEASRGCLHLCRHCPIPPVYEGRFFVVPREVVLEDISRQVDLGARHITFGDPDFLNGPGHASAIVRAMHERFPELTFDFTAKVEHILKHRELVHEFGQSGCVFLISAFESTSDLVLSKLDKGHTRAGMDAALRVADDAGIPIRPSLLPFTPWTTRFDIFDLFDFVEQHELIENVDPVHFSIRLLLPPGSLLLDTIRNDRSVSATLGPFDERMFGFTWRHADASLDALQSAIARRVEAAARTREGSDKDGSDADGSDADISDTLREITRDEPFVLFESLRALADEHLEPRAAHQTQLKRADRSTKHSRRRPPRMTESWFC